MTEIESRRRSSGTSVQAQLIGCWLCRRTTARHNPFCQACGAVQPNQELDHFARFGLTPRFDIDLDLLDQVYRALEDALASRALTPRDPQERQMIARHREQLAEAQAVLRSPERRARYLMRLLWDDTLAPVPQQPDAAVEALRERLSHADGNGLDAAVCAVEAAATQSLRSIAEGFRAEDGAAVQAALARLAALQHLADEGREKRRLAPPPAPGSAS